VKNPGPAFILRTFGGRLLNKKFLDRNDIVQVMYEMIRCVVLDELSVGAAAAAFGVSPQVFHSAKQAFENDGLAGLLRLADPTTPPSAKFVSHGLHIDFAARKVRTGKRNIRLTPKEFDLLRHLVSNAGKPVSHRSLLKWVWGLKGEKKISYLRVYVNSLRKKIERDTDNQKYILTDPCFGYRFAHSLKHSE
jgi:DNA-binding winged helix-turn-helix (wHTH) protein